MAQAATRKPRQRATYDDIAALPQGIVGEIIDGELVTHPRPAPPQARSSTNLGYFIVGPFGLGINGPGGVRTLGVLRLHDGTWLLAATYGSDETVRAEPFEAIELQLQLVWGDGS